MRRKATMLTCDICGAADTITFNDDGRIQSKGWKELYLGDPGYLYNCPQANDICPACANKVMKLIARLKGETI